MYKAIKSLTQKGLKRSIPLPNKNSGLTPILEDGRGGGGPSFGMGVGVNNSSRYAHGAYDLTPYLKQTKIWPMGSKSLVFKMCLVDSKRFDSAF
jgi:hypothetical protein